MAVITPQTNIRIMKLPLELDSKNQLTFTSENNQEYYFTHIEDYIEIENATYMRQDGTLRFPGSYDEVIQYNYCMYKNEAFSDKWFYAYITDVQWLSPNSVGIKLKTDVFQTWQFDIEYKQSFVEREHVNDDTIGLHTIPEGLETGEYVTIGAEPITAGDYETCFCVATSEPVLSGYSTLNELIPTGLYYVGLTTLDGVKDYINKIATTSGKEIVNSVFAIPKVFFSEWRSGESLDIDGEYSITIKFTMSPDIINITKPTTLAENYSPRNKKLMCFPYNFLQVSNHNGQIVNYSYEEFNKITPTNQTCNFAIRGAFSQGGSFSCYPVDYKRTLNNVDEGITMGKYPIGGWNNDAYTNWMTQNSVNNGLKMIGGISGVLIGAGMIATGVGGIAGAGILGSGVGLITDNLKTQYQHSFAPEQALGNTNAGDYSFAFDLTNFDFKKISIKKEYSQVIDKFFDMFGYKVNITKVPNITGRSNWNFVKTIGCNIHLYAPDSDVKELKDMFDNGITLWHHSTTYLDYSQSNNIV